MNPLIAEMPVRSLFLPGILLQLVCIVAFNLCYAAFKISAVTVPMHGSAFVMCVVDMACLEVPVIFVADLPAMPGVL